MALLLLSPLHGSRPPGDGALDVGAFGWAWDPTLRNEYNVTGPRRTNNHAWAQEPGLHFLLDVRARAPPNP